MSAPKNSPSTNPSPEPLRTPSAERKPNTLELYMRPIGDYDCEISLDLVEFASRTTIFTTHIPRPDRLTMQSCLM